MEHINDKILEKLFISPDEISSQEKDDIASHLEKCALCREHVAKLKDFYKDLQANLDTQPTERDKAFAEKLLVRPRLALPEKKLALHERVDNALSTFVEIIEPYHRPLAERVWSYIRIHPLRTAGGFSFAAVLMIFALSLIIPLKDKNPSYARAKDEYLVVYNKEGKELWRKHIGIGYDLDKLLKQEQYVDPETYLQAVDVDGDGKKEIIATFGLISKWQSKNGIFCYNYDGKERWTYYFNRQMKFGNTQFSDAYSFRNFIVGDFDKNGSIEIISVAYHEGWYPTAIISLNASDGKLINEYWHSGCVQIQTLVNKDLDNDGIDEILAGGENNGFNLAFLLVLDPRNFKGHSPAPYEYTPNNIPPGNEKYYLLIDRSDIKEYASIPRNKLTSIRFSSDGSIITPVQEEIERMNYVILYTFNSNLECINIDGEDKSVTLHDKFVDEGKLSKKIDKQYYEDLRKGIKYWDGEKFVNTPTMNKKYVEMAIRLP